jgi:hypothetical protein
MRQHQRKWGSGERNLEKLVSGLPQKRKRKSITTAWR